MLAINLTHVAFMKILDASHAKDALPHIAGSAGPTPDGAISLVTSCPVSSSSVLLMTG